MDIIMTTYGSDSIRLDLAGTDTERNTWAAASIRFEIWGS